MSESKPLSAHDEGDDVRRLVAVPEQMLDELEDEVRDVLHGSLAVVVQDVQEDLIEGALLDSLALVELLFALERKFELVLVVGELDIENFRSVERIARFIAEERGRASA